MSAYPLVNITNLTPFSISGTVEYLSAFCSNDDYQVPGHGKWQARSRGACLVSRITATINMKDGKVVKATAYASSGTSYSQFMVTQRGTSDVFDVLRITDGSTDNAPDGYTEPTTQQK